MRNQYCHKCACKLSGDCVQLDGISYHRYCLNCHGCGATLINLDFFKKYDRYYCSSCNQRRFGKYCKMCKDAIKGEYIANGENAYHPKCFRCEDCHALIGTPYYLHKGRILCKSDCMKHVQRESEENRISSRLDDEPDCAPSFENSIRGRSKVTVSGDFNFRNGESDQAEEQIPQLHVDEEKKPKHSKLADVLYCIMGFCI